MKIRRLSYSQVRPKRLSTKKANRILPKWLSDNTVEAVRGARGSFTIYLLFVIYGILSIVGITDHQIALNEGMCLPVIKISVPIDAFFFVFPLAAILLYIHFQIYYYRLRLLSLESKETRRTDKEILLFPWFGIMRLEKPPLLALLQRELRYLAIWISLPAVLFLNAFWIIKKHSLIHSYGLVILAIAGTLLTLPYWWGYKDKRYKHKLKAKERITRRLKRTPVTSFLLFILFFAQIYLLFIIPVAHCGWLLKYRENNVSWSRNIVNDRLRPHFVLDLSHECLIKKPLLDYPNLYWADFKGRHFEGADISNSVLRRADLRDASLNGANLSKSILDSADLQQADLSGADLRETDLTGADLGAVIFLCSNLNGVRDLTVNQLSEVKTLQGTHMNLIWRDSLQYLPEHLAEELREANNW